ncbi:MAG: hypothetical protein QCI00_02275 [Candidatus Thermoplasmatota archaeon]|nr:hypothetical protein [Candidatus Thermoplasmatota archaeon]
MMIFGFELPLWAVFIGGIVVVLLAWKLIKFAIKILLGLLVFFALLFGLDLLGFFNWLQNTLSSFF